MNTDDYAVTLESWWENAEQGAVSKGDTVINRGDGETVIYKATESFTKPHPHARILHRAAPPRPTWTDAVAVIADAADDITPARRTFTRQANWLWKDDDRQLYTADVLVNVTPLIEQRVTEAMIDRLWEVMKDHTGEKEKYRPGYEGEMRAYANAALGIDPA